MESLIFLTEKRDKSVKARTCANGSTQRSYISREETASPTAATESVRITGFIEAKQQRDLITLDVPNAFVQIPMPQGKDTVIKKIRGVLVDILVDLCPRVYDEYIIYEQVCKDIKTIGLVANPYDVREANRQVGTKQHTVSWHVDNVKSSHVNPQ
eukprot:1432122-Ditylum_brightwellii.AAC.1